jgi:hypothetical protein
MFQIIREIHRTGTATAVTEAAGARRPATATPRVGRIVLEGTSGSRRIPTQGCTSAWSGRRPRASGDAGRRRWGRPTGGYQICEFASVGRDGVSV